MKKSDQPSDTTGEPAAKRDAAPQFAKSRGDAKNSGLDSAAPRVTGPDESIAKDWDAGYTEPDPSLPKRPK